MTSAEEQNLKNRILSLLTVLGIVILIVFFAVIVPAGLGKAVIVSESYMNWILVTGGRGWNTWSPVGVFEKPFYASDLFRLNPDMSALAEWDAQKQRYKMVVNDAYLITFLDIEIVPGKGYWIYQTTDDGTYWGPMAFPNQAITLPLYRGWNLVGQCGPYQKHIYDRNQFYASSYIKTFVKNCTPTLMADLHLGKYRVYYPSCTNFSSEDFPIVPFKGYWLYVPTSGGYLTFPTTY